MIRIEKKLARLLSRYSEIKLAILFGSQAQGDAGPDSDVDLGVLMATPMSAVLKLELIELIGTELGRPADIVDLYDAAEPVLGEVLKGKRLLGDSARFAGLLTRHLINAADFVPLQQRILAERRAAWISK